MKEHYLQSVCVLLDCPPKEKKRLLSRLDRAVAAYLEDLPDVAEADLTGNFGTPEECAACLLDECAPGEVAAERQKQKRRRCAVIAILALLLVIAAGATYCYWHTHGGYAIILTDDDIPESMKDLPLGQVTYSYEE